MEEVKQHPLIIVFYLNADMMKQTNIIRPFAESVNQLLAQKQANALAFFIPTQGEERVECINPVVLEQPDMDKIYKIVEDLTKSFDMAASKLEKLGEVKEGTPPVEEGPTEEGTPKKECTCEGDGTCNCEKTND